MARAEVARHWPDGESLVVTIAVSESYPDSVAEARANVRALYAEALEITLAPVESDDEAGE
jgi:hypothetical protein